ncbi:MAG: hypothetical protein FJW92_05870, partial [Actinobacteria bacterium]|nr:hypothetical protein [Actinomycetota bacterium]
PGADILAGEVESAITLVPADGWLPPVLLTQALDGQGVEDAWDAVERHRADLVASGLADERARDGMRRNLRSLALERMARDLAVRADDATLDALAARVISREIDPATAIDSILGTSSPEEG